MTATLFKFKKYKGKKFIIHLDEVTDEKYIFSCFVCGKKNYIIATVEVYKTPLGLDYNIEAVYDFILRKAYKEWKIAKKQN